MDDMLIERQLKLVMVIWYCLHHVTFVFIMCVWLNS